MKILTRRAHGVADYVMVVVFLCLPMVMGLTGTPRALSYAFALLHLLLTGFSKFPPGGVALLSFRVHAVVELVAGIFLMASPWLLHFDNDDTARSAFIVIGAVLLMMALFTGFERRKTTVPPPPGDRRRWYNRRSG